jgi:hypothetical protein
VLPLAADPVSAEPHLAETKRALGDEHEQLLKSVPTNVQTQIAARRNVPRRAGCWRPRQDRVFVERSPDAQQWLVAFVRPGHLAGPPFGTAG